MAAWTDLDPAFRGVTTKRTFYEVIKFFDSSNRVSVSSGFPSLARPQSGYFPYFLMALLMARTHSGLRRSAADHVSSAGGKIRMIFHLAFGLFRRAHPEDVRSKSGSSRSGPHTSVSPPGCPWPPFRSVGCGDPKDIMDFMMFPSLWRNREWLTLSRTLGTGAR